MLFNSYEFIFFFLPVSFFIYFYLNKKRLTEASKGFLVFSSLFFYSWWNVIYLPLILGSMLFNYVIGASLTRYGEQKKISKKYLLVTGVAGNLLLLGYFKYADFFINNLSVITGAHLTPLNLALPLAISFFTFQQIAYLVDSYRAETKEYDFLNYAVFVSFFPQLIAGPIVHHKEMMPQFAKVRNKVINYRNVSLGTFLFSMGLFKKVGIADVFEKWASSGFDEAVTLSFFEGWATSLSYSFQLYFDFSGYTDMAMGAALLFNIRLPINFNSPYKALDIQDFWRRWHITLSRFLRDYVYIPLGGNRVSEYKVYTNLMITFLLGGLWHGAGWTFVFWGFMHGLALVIYRTWKKYNLKMNRVLAWLITFNFVNLSWVFFRAENWADAIKVLQAMCGLNGVTLSEKYIESLSFLIDYGVTFDLWLANINGKKAYTWIFIGFILIVLKNSNELQYKFRSNLNYVIATVFMLSLSVLQLGEVSEFLYFNF